MKRVTQRALFAPKANALRHDARRCSGGRGFSGVPPAGHRRHRGWRSCARGGSPETLANRWRLPSLCARLTHSGEAICVFGAPIPLLTNRPDSRRKEKGKASEREPESQTTETKEKKHRRSASKTTRNRPHAETKAADNHPTSSPTLPPCLTRCRHSSLHGSPAGSQSEPSASHAKQTIGNHTNEPRWALYKAPCRETLDNPRLLPGCSQTALPTNRLARSASATPPLRPASDRAECHCESLPSNRHLRTGHYPSSAVTAHAQPMGHECWRATPAPPAPSRAAPNGTPEGALRMCGIGHRRKGARAEAAQLTNHSGPQAPLHPSPVGAHRDPEADQRARALMRPVVRPSL